MIRESSFQLLELAGTGYPDFQERPVEGPSWVPWWNLDRVKGERKRAVWRSMFYETAMHIQRHVVHGDDDDGLIQIEGSVIDEIAAVSLVWFSAVSQLPSQHQR